MVLILYLKIRYIFKVFIFSKLNIFLNAECIFSCLPGLW